ncbi:MAG: chorismate synthase [Bacteroidetes bacterium RIFOXYA12_FULL_35_11]|nr:MAG: chorismate synthase [Bacteroidetes bacterium GWF2_35_48]OFY79306.1 MAG: chorismate synthase [Bacteroidetes bacterium RIFOXYA12_FULL_35_11]HBX51944.1 chorismate synthase [Bacteroidales bacterium]
MAGNSFGKIFKLTSFGESHGTAVGGIIDGCPSGIKINIDAIQKELNRRKPGQSKISTSRNENDNIEFLSGIFNNVTLGTPIAFAIFNKDQNSKDYNQLKSIYRPSHADFTYQEKFGIRDHRGGGRASARETLSRVVAGAIAKQILEKYKISISAYVSQVGNVKLKKNYLQYDLTKTETNIVRCPDENAAKKMIRLIEQTQKNGDSLGGAITCIAKNVPAGIGEPVFDKLHAEIGKAVLSIPACKGFEIGSGFDAASMYGSQHNDIFQINKNKITTKTNFSGGIQGGISNGQDIYFRAAFKPVATIMSAQESINTENQNIIFKAEGRHDSCVVPRAVPIVEAMTAIVLLDQLLLQKISQH